jgi:hypothetical protein
MLSTGIRTPVGVKIFGTDLTEMEKLARQVEQVLKTVPGTTSACAERVIGGYYLDVTPNRDLLARYGLMVGDVQDVVAMALGGETVTTTVEGRETLHRQHSLSSRPQKQSAGDRQRRAGAAGLRRHGAAGRGGVGQARARPHDHPHRKRSTGGVCVRRYPRP